jgi:drug/metabolite transporter (DMT)-like permease
MARAPQGDDPPPRVVDWRVHGALLTVQAVFAGYHVVAKVVLDHLDPIALIVLRTGLAAPILVALAWSVDRVLPSLRDLPMLALLGFLGVFANQLLFIHGLQWTTATNAAILMPSIPVFAVAVAVLLRIERVGLVRTLGILLAAGGALVMVNPLDFDHGVHAHAALKGNALILGNCLCFATYLVVQRPILRRLPWRTVVAGAFSFGALGVVVLALLPFGPTLEPAELAGVPAGAWWGIVYIVLFPTVLSYSLNTWAVRRSSPTLTAAYTTFQPVFTAALAAVVLAERPGWHGAVGFALIVAGLMVVSRRSRAAPAQR